MVPRYRTVIFFILTALYLTCVIVLATSEKKPLWMIAWALLSTISMGLASGLNGIAESKWFSKIPIVFRFRLKVLVGKERFMQCDEHYLFFFEDPQKTVCTEEDGPKWFIFSPRNITNLKERIEFTLLACSETALKCNMSLLSPGFQFYTLYPNEAKAHLKPLKRKDLPLYIDAAFKTAKFEQIIKG